MALTRPGVPGQPERSELRVLDLAALSGTSVSSVNYDATGCHAFLPGLLEGVREPCAKRPSEERSVQLVVN